MQKKIKVQEEGRLDAVLTRALDDESRSSVQRLIKDGRVKVDKKIVSKPSFDVSVDDFIEVNMPKLKDSSAVPENIELDIVYEDKNMVIVNKPYGMVVHPTESGDHLSGTLVNALLHHIKDLSGIGGELRPGIVHRIDKDTSGLLMVAKNDKTHRYLSTLLKDRKIIKKYKALVWGHMESEEGEINSPIARSTRDRKQMAVRGDGKEAITRFKVIDTLEKADLLDIQILTGRTHQIRVHLESINHPVVGDPIYGSKSANKYYSKLGLGRMFLHSYYLEFEDVNGETMKFEVGLPEELEI